MTNEIEIFNNPSFGNIRVQKDEDGEPLFCLADVCRALEISDPSNVSRQVMTEFELPVLKTGCFDTGFGIKELNLITEQQLYFVMNRSDKPNAKPFRMWVNTVVLPSIRKTDGSRLAILEPVKAPLFVEAVEHTPVFDISGLRHFEEGDKIWFCLVDIGRMLEIADSSMRSMKSRDWFDEDEITTVANCNAGSDITYVSESALYRIINRSNSPKARPFERWVTKEVLPSIRKHGMYATPATLENMIADPDFAISLFKSLKEERIARQQAEEEKAIAEQKVDDLTEAFSRSIVSDKDKLYSTFIKELKLTIPCASSILQELKVFGKNGHLADYGDWFKIKVSDNGFPARFVTPMGQMMLVNLFNANRDKMRAIGGTYRYIKPADRCQIIKLPEDVCKKF